MQSLNFILTTVLNLYAFVLLLRVWMQWARADFYNPFSQFVVKITQPVVRPLRRIVPSIGPIDSASLLVAYVAVLLKLLIPFWLMAGQIFLPSVKMFPFALLEVFVSVGTLIFWMIFARAILSWVSQGRNPVDYVLMQLTEPLMAPIRRIIPPMGGIDFSAMIVILVLYALNYLHQDIVVWLLG